MIPQPPLRFSMCLTGGGFTISKNLKRKNVILRGIILGGVKKRGMRIEAYSSITMRRGSLPQSFARLSDTKTPREKSTAVHIMYSILYEIRKYQRAIPMKHENVAGATGT